MITGSIVALVTPMHSDGSIDWQALSRLIEWHIEQGTDGIVAVGTSGESATLGMDEHKMFIKACVDQVAGRAKVIAGTGANSTSEAIELTEVAREVGADACLLVTPYYNKPTQEGLYRHYMAIADAVAIPQILYNVPGRTACDMQNATVARLATHPNIIAIKDATGDVSRGRELIDETGGTVDTVPTKVYRTGSWIDCSLRVVLPGQHHRTGGRREDGQGRRWRRMEQRATCG